jgi:hypothetical protein
MIREALETGDVIGQAKGVIMANLTCSPDEAFHLLRQHLQHENRKVLDLAVGIARAGVVTLQRTGQSTRRADPERHAESPDRLCVDTERREVAAWALPFPGSVESARTPFRGLRRGGLRRADRVYCRGWIVLS